MTLPLQIKRTGTAKVDATPLQAAELVAALGLPPAEQILTAQRGMLITGTQLLFADIHNNRQLLHYGLAATYTYATDAQADEAGRVRWIDGMGCDIATLPTANGPPTLATPDGKSIVGAEPKGIGGLCKGADIWNVGTSDPTPGIALQAGILTAATNVAASPAAVIAFVQSAIALAIAGLQVGAPSPAPTPAPSPTPSPSPSPSPSPAPSPAPPPAPAFTAQSAPAGTVGAAYTYQFAASNATSYAVASGTLPAGLALSSAGLLSGNPTTAATSNFTVAASGTGGTTASAAIALTIAPPAATVAYSTAPTALRTYQRITTSGGGAGKGQGSVPVSITTSAATPIYARTRATDGTTVLQAPWQVSASATTGSLTITGVDARPVSFFLDIGPTVSGPWAPSTTAIQMGRGIAIEGQSLAQAFFKPFFGASLASVGVTPSPTSRVFASYADSPGSAYVAPQWLQPADGTIYASAGVAEFLRLQEIASGVACFAIGAPVGGTAISHYVPGGGGNATMRSVIDTAAGMEAVIVFIGHTDANSGTLERDFRSRLGQVFDEHTSRNVARGTAIDKLVLTMPNINSSSWGSPESRRAIRNAGWRWAEENGGTFVAPSDISLGDGVHEDQVGAVTLARHMHRALRPALGLSGSDVGPKVTGATRSGVNVTLAVSLPTGATALTSVGSPAQRFTVFAAGTSTTALALDATTPITVGTTSITLKLAADPGGAVDVHVMYQNDTVSDGAANCIFDNHTDGDGITRGRQLMPTRAPATTDGVSNVLAVGNNFNMSYDTYGASLTTAFQQKLTAGFGNASGNWSPLPDSSTWTWEARFSHTGSISGGEYLVYHGGRFQIRGNIGTLNVELLSGNSPQTVAVTPTVNDGAEHHLRVVGTPTAVYVYCDGVLCGTGSGAAGSGGGQSNSIGTNWGSPLDYRWYGTQDETACFVSALSTGASFTVPTTPYAATEPNLCALYHFEGNGNAATRTATV